MILLFIKKDSFVRNLFIHTFFLFTFSFSASELWAQSALPNEVSSVDKWQPVNTATDSVFLWHFSFGESSPETELALKMLKNRHITRIQLVYTKYSSVKNFDQAALNQRRLEMLYAARPEWFESKNKIEWQLVEQTNCHSNKECEDFFHGFAIYYTTELGKQNAKSSSNQSPTADYLQTPNNQKRDLSREDEEEAFAAGLVTQRQTAYLIDFSEYPLMPELSDSLVAELKRLDLKPETAQEESKRVEDLEKLVNDAEREDEDEKEDEKEGAKVSEENHTTNDSLGKRTTPIKSIKSPSKQKRVLVEKQRSTRIKNIREKYAPTAYHKKTITLKQSTPRVNKKTVVAKSKPTKFGFKDKQLLKTQYTIAYWGKLMNLRDDQGARRLFHFLISVKNDCVCHPERCRLDTIWRDTICRECKMLRRGSEMQPIEYEGSVPETLNRLEKKYAHFNIVSDVTKGMIKPNLELFDWMIHPQHLSKLAQGTFYNDGDKLPDEEKQIGRTGGIYTTAGYRAVSSKKTSFRTSLLRLQNTACKAIHSGSGGHTVTENAIEALLKAEAECSISDATVLIADNRSPIRDLSLLKNLKTPIHIIAVFAERERGLINTDYLELAYKTQGCIHTRTQDYNDIGKMKNGDTLQLFSYTYMLKDGKFFCVKMPKE